MFRRRIPLDSATGMRLCAGSIRSSTLNTRNHSVLLPIPTTWSMCCRINRFRRASGQILPSGIRSDTSTRATHSAADSRLAGTDDGVDHVAGEHPLELGRNECDRRRVVCPCVGYRCGCGSPLMVNFVRRRSPSS